MGESQDSIEMKPSPVGHNVEKHVAPLYAHAAWFVDTRIRTPEI